MTVIENPSIPATIDLLESNLQTLKQWRSLAIAFLVLSVIFVSLRLVARKPLGRVSWGWDDYLVIGPALISNLAVCVAALCYIYFTKRTIYYTLGNRDALQLFASEETYEDPSGGKSDYAMMIAYNPAVAFPRLSICALYLRVFNTRRARIATYVLIGLLVTNCFAFLMVSIFVCNPPSRIWSHQELQPRDCIDIFAFYKAISVPNIFIDVAIIVLPIRTAWNLQASLAKRLGLVLTFLTGGIGLIAALLRFISSVVGTQGAILIWDITIIVEPVTGLIAACLPPLGGLVSQAVRSEASQRWFKRFTMRRRESSMDEGRAALNHKGHIELIAEAKIMRLQKESQFSSLAEESVPQTPSSRGERDVEIGP